MKVLFIESKLKDVEFELDSKELKKLPRELFLAYSIQYKDLALRLKSQLVDNRIKVVGFRQVLGCSMVKSDVPIFLIGSGRFHAINLFLQVPDVYLLEGKKIVKVSKSEIEDVKRKRKIALMNFLNADKVGILVSTKPGQEKMKNAIELKSKLIKNGKEVWIFICDNIDVGQFENFNIDSWVNSACSGLVNDNSNIINYNKLLEEF